MTGTPFFFLWPFLWPMEVPRLGVKLKLWLPAYATATATPDLNHIYTSITYIAACGNATSLTHWVRPGIEPTFSQTLCWVLNWLGCIRNYPSLPFFLCGHIPNLMNGAGNKVDNKKNTFCWTNDWKKLKNITNPIKDVLFIALLPLKDAFRILTWMSVISLLSLLSWIHKDRVETPHQMTYFLQFRKRFPAGLESLL